MKIELTDEEFRLVVYALKAHALREAEKYLDNPNSALYWNLSEKLLVRHGSDIDQPKRKEGDGLLCVMCDREATEVGPKGPVCNDCAKYMNNE